MDERNHEGAVDHQAHEEHPGCTCGGVCRITGDCGKHLLRGDRQDGAREDVEEE